MITIEIEDDEDKVVGMDLELPEGMSLKDLRLKIAKMLEEEGIEVDLWN